MNALADRVADSDVASVFIYTHEAPPAENYGHLTSMDQKMEHACGLRDKLGITRDILVDALDGACHRAYGSMPNMTWIFNRAMIPIYKSDWTDANSVSNAIDYFLDVSGRRKDREKLAPFHVERLDYRNADREAFYKGLRAEWAEGGGGVSEGFLKSFNAEDSGDAEKTIAGKTVRRQPERCTPHGIPRHVITDETSKK